MLFPSMISSSFCLVELLTVTPGDIFTRLINFSPKKFLISSTVLFSVVTQFMGKWAYTALILYRNPWNKQRLWKYSHKQEHLQHKQMLTYLCDTLDHVWNVWTYGTNCSKFLLGSEPLFNTKFVVFSHVHVQWQMPERSLKDSSRPLDGDNTVLHRAF